MNIFIKSIKILSFLLVIVLSGYMGYLSYFVFSPIGEVIHTVYESVVFTDTLRTNIKEHNAEAGYQLKLALAKTKSLFTKNTSEMQILQSNREAEISEKENEKVIVSEEIEKIRKNIVLLPYVMSTFV